MIPASLVVTLIVCCSLYTAALAAEPYVAPGAPRDTPEEARGKAEIEALLKVIEPAMETARRTYPQARDRFLRGLPPQHSFFVLIRLPAEQKGVEQVFLAVDRIDKGTIYGRIWSDILRARPYKKGDRYSVPEDQIVDWLITRPDGSEEGNYVGKAIDKLQTERAQGLGRRKRE